ncbi:MAG: hypothetical protein K9N10_09985 [Deltaproteobacteria bacterium]|nr:hypothetical protein [Deltaproteobacteria bacterium]
MKPFVTTGLEIGAASFPITQFLSGRQCGIPLTSGLQNRLKDAPVKAIQKQLVLELFVILVAGAGIQLTEKGQHGKEKNQ